jgi:hypothetical protein
MMNLINKSKRTVMYSTVEVVSGKSAIGIRNKSTKYHW